MSNQKKQNKMRNLQTKNGSAREVICTRVEIGNYFPNGSMVQPGKKYHLVKTEVHPWYTEVYLKEFPGKVFNSVQFAECFSKEADVCKTIKANGRERRIIALFTENTIPQILLSENTTIDLSSYKDEIKLLEYGEVFSIGRENCEVSLPQESIYSRLHCYVCRTQKGKYALVDCSLNGTIVSL